MPAISNAVLSQHVVKAQDLAKDAHDRCDKLEAWVFAFSHMRFWRRMRWLVTGK